MVTDREKASSLLPTQRKDRTMKEHPVQENPLRFNPALATFAGIEPRACLFVSCGEKIAHSYFKKVSDYGPLALVWECEHGHKFAKFFALPKGYQQPGYNPIHN